MLIPWKSAFFIPLRLITTLGKRPLNCVLLPSAAVIQPPQSSVPAVAAAAASQASHTRPTVYSSDQLRWRRLHTWAPSRTPLMSSSVFPVQRFHMRNRIFSSLLCGGRLGAQRYSPNPCMGTKRCSSVAQFNTLSGLKSQLCDFMSRIQILSGNPALSFFSFFWAPSSSSFSSFCGNSTLLPGDCTGVDTWRAHAVHEQDEFDLFD